MDATVSPSESDWADVQSDAIDLTNETSPENNSWFNKQNNMGKSQSNTSLVVLTNEESPASSAASHSKKRTRPTLHKHQKQIKINRYPRSNENLEADDLPTLKSRVLTINSLTAEFNGNRLVNVRPLSQNDTATGDIDMLPTLDGDQMKAMNLILSGKNCLILGSAGTGKSLLLKHVKQNLDAMNRVYSVMTPTGISALAIGGSTLHATSGVGIPTSPDDFKRMFTHADRIRKVDVWIIDEISMVSAEFFDHLEFTTQKIRCYQRNKACEKCAQINESGRRFQGDGCPFGGIQIILFGDFLQLPPIETKLTTAQLEFMMSRNHGLKREDIFLNQGFAFQAVSWARCDINIIRLQTVHRQHDKDLVVALQRIRKGKGSSMEVQNLIRECSNNPLRRFCGECKICVQKQSVGPPIVPTVLRCRNVEADQINAQCLDDLPHKLILYEAQKNIEVDDELDSDMMKRLAQDLLNTEYKNLQALQELPLKLNTRVMLIKNLTNGLVNGSQGQIIRMVPKNELLRIFNSKIKESQEGNTVGLGCRDEKELEHLRGCKKIVMNCPSSCFPIVHFNSGEKCLILPEQFSSTIPHAGTVECFQLPLKHAWCITVHKSQGMSIDHLSVSLHDAFEDGQAYVGLSRSTGKCGLTIASFDPSKVSASKRALAFEETGNRGKTWLMEAKEDWAQLMAKMLRVKVKAPNCFCSQKCREYTVRKHGPNQGRTFFGCARQMSNPNRCKYFIWESEIRNRQHNRVRATKQH